MVRDLILVILWTALSSDALAPPHPDFQWESVHSMRRRLNISYHYDPVHMSAEYCRYLTEEECKTEDELAGEYRQKHRDRTARRKLQASEGIFRVPVVLIRFTDHIDRILPSKEYFEDMLNGNGPGEANTVGSIKEWLRYNSLGRYRVSFEVHDWETTNNTEAFFARGRSGLYSATQLTAMFTPVLDKLEQARGVDFGRYDMDQDGELDHAVFIHSGYPAELGPPPTGCDVNDVTDRIWSQGATGVRRGSWVSRDGIQLDHHLIGGALGPRVCINTPAGMGIITHEYMHAYSLIDVYDQDRDDENVLVGGVASFDIMANAYGWRGDMSRPGHLSAFSRVTPGWLEPIEIVEDGFYLIQPAEISSQIYTIRTGFPEDEYLMIENRQPIKWDEDMPAGIVIYHIDDSLWDMSKRGYPGKEGFPADHYRVAVLQADGNYDLEKGNNLGDEGDFWRKDMVLGPGTGGVWPNTDSYKDGVHVETGITITILSDPGFLMAIRVDGVSARRAPGYPANDANGGLRPGPLGDESREPSSTGEVLAWILSILTGVAFMTGLAAAVLL